jgi:hypothetical protein
LIIIETPDITYEAVSQGTQGSTANRMAESRLQCDICVYWSFVHEKVFDIILIRAKGLIMKREI